MTNEDMTQHPTAAGEQSPVGDEGTAAHGSVATEAPVTQEIPEPPQPAQVRHHLPRRPGRRRRAPARMSPWLMAFLALLLVVGSSAATYLITTVDNDEVPAAQTAERGSTDCRRAGLRVRSRWPTQPP